MCSWPKSEEQPWMKRRRKWAVDWCEEETAFRESQCQDKLHMHMHVSMKRMACMR